ncbi:MAG TPA: hypothetical protein VJ252_07045 [Chthoniobacterales bacterium]|nr:hypothetical protein [Chthoniobacterales bacterium]
MVAALAFSTTANPATAAPAAMVTLRMKLRRDRSLQLWHSPLTEAFLLSQLLRSGVRIVQKVERNIRNIAVRSYAFLVICMPSLVMIDLADCKRRVG